MRDINHPTSKIVLFSGLFLLLFTTVPLSAEAKVNRAAGFAKGRAQSVSVLPVDTAQRDAGLITTTALTVSADKKIETEMDLYKKMAVIRINPARPWRIFPRPARLTVSISGLTPGQTYYLYREKLRDPEIFTAESNGSHSLSLDTPRHRYLILKTSPSTIHIDDDSTGGECGQIGTWDNSTKTCTLNPTAAINEIIEIDDGGITLDGNGRLITHSDTIGIYANEDPFEPAMTNIIIKNVRVSGLTNGISLIDISDSVVENVTVKSNTTGISLKDDTNITVRNSTVWSNSAGFTTRNGNNIKLYRNNFKENTSDLANINGSLILSDATLRGNFWSKFAGCAQDTGNPSHCTNSYDPGPVTDALPWACENGWTHTCPVAPGGGGGGGGGSPFPSFRQNDLRWADNVYDHSDINPIKCGLTSRILNLGIRSCGCLITSIVNVLHSYGITKDTDNNEISPALLDDWLSVNNGYNQKGELFWNKIEGFVKSRTSQAVKFNYGAFVSTTVSEQNVFTGVDNSLTNNIPSIVMTHDGSHFLVVYGKDGQRYKVRDPSWYDTNYLDEPGPATPTLKMYANRLGGFNTYEKVSRSTSLSSILFILGSPAELVITDPTGKKLGYNPTTNTSYNEISGATYWTQSFLAPELVGVVNPDESKYVWIPYPISGEYKVEVIGVSNGSYSLDVSSYNNLDQSFVINRTGNIAKDQVVEYKLVYDTTGATTINNLTKDKVLLCHIPPGNKLNPQTIVVGKSALPAHLKHGDYLGQCLSIKTKKK